MPSHPGSTHNPVPSSAFNLGAGGVDPFALTATSGQVGRGGATDSVAMADSNFDSLTKSNATDVFDTGESVAPIPAQDFTFNTPSAGTEHNPLEPTKSKGLTDGQTVGLAAASTAFGVAEGFAQIKDDEAIAMRAIDENFKEFEFNMQLQKTMHMVSETRGIIAAIKNLNRQGANTSSDRQAFIQSPTSRSLL